MPLRNALPYPLTGACTTRAPCRSATSTEVSLEPLSATTTSPAIPAASNAARALSMQAPRVRSSLRQGMTTDTSGKVRAGVAGLAPGSSELVEMSATASTDPPKKMDNGLHPCANGKYGSTHQLRKCTFKSKERQPGGADPKQSGKSVRSQHPLCCVILRNPLRKCSRAMPMRHQYGGCAPARLRWRRMATHVM